MVEGLQNSLHPLSSHVVLRVFALANAGVALGDGALGDADLRGGTVLLVLSTRGHGRDEPAEAGMSRERTAEEHSDVPRSG